VADAYQAHGTPMAVVISSAGVIESPTVGGSEAITKLVAQAGQPTLAVQQGAAGDGHRNGFVRPTAQPRATSRVGEAAPDLALRTLDGEQVALGDLYGERAVVVFWNPACGFCQRMLPDLKALEDHPPAGTPPLLVISSGDPDRIREQEIRSRVLVDGDGEAMRAFGAGGTPMGVLVEAGKLASPVAAGADAVFALIGAGRDERSAASNGSVG
jgi:protein-disulfide isomerase